MRLCVLFILFFKQKTAYEMRISDWSSDVCSSDLSSANAESHGAATCFHSAALAVSRSKFASHVIDYLPRNPTPARHRESELADRKRRCLCHLSARSVAMIRIDAIWLATETMDKIGRAHV